ncbi:hypothetical protein DPV78_012810 [Talaromyces pinophilus]|nr:hypothetical protein DPV78_012810 [Talaromyces pinophilus]
MEIWIIQEAGCTPSTGQNVLFEDAGIVISDRFDMDIIWIVDGSTNFSPATRSSLTKPSDPASVQHRGVSRERDARTMKDKYESHCHRGSMYLRVTSKGGGIQVMSWLADDAALLVTIHGDGAANIATQPSQIPTLEGTITEYRDRVQGVKLDDLAPRSISYENKKEGVIVEQQEYVISESWHG